MERHAGFRSPPLSSYYDRHSRPSSLVSTTIRSTPSLAYAPVVLTMVVSQGRKTTKSKKTASRVSVEIRRNIPFKKEDFVTRTDISRKANGRVVTKSTKVVVPIAPPKPLDPPLAPPPDQDDAPAPSKKKRKGPSRSATVSFPLFHFFHQQTNIYLDKTGGMASVQGGIFRRVHQT